MGATVGTNVVGVEVVGTLVGVAVGFDVETGLNVVEDDVELDVIKRPARTKSPFT